MNNDDMDASRLTRPVHAMPAMIAAALDEHGLWERYQVRPPYQRNDYVAWITRAKRAETQQKRLTQMLDELKAGNTYMGMAYKAR